MLYCYCYIVIVTVEEYFEHNPQYNLCYCENCLEDRKDNKIYNRGSPPRKYIVPIGWARFSLRYVNNTSLSEIVINSRDKHLHNMLAHNTPNPKN